MTKLGRPRGPDRNVWQAGLWPAGHARHSWFHCYNLQLVRCYVHGTDAVLTAECDELMAANDNAGDEDEDEDTEDDDDVSVDIDETDVLDARREFIELLRREEFGVNVELSDDALRLMEKQQQRLGRSLERLSKDLYSKDTHFVLELVQNADDNAYLSEMLEYVL